MVVVPRPSPKMCGGLLAQVSTFSLDVLFAPHNLPGFLKPLMVKVSDAVVVNGGGCRQCPMFHPVDQLTSPHTEMPGCLSRCQIPGQLWSGHFIYLASGIKLLAHISDFVNTFLNISQSIPNLP